MTGPSVLDTRGARLVALVLFVACLAAIAWMHRADLWPQLAAEEEGLNPEFVACRTERTATVDSMLAEGLIDEQRHARFTERAVAICAGQFPPDAAGE